MKQKKKKEDAPTLDYWINELEAIPPVEIKTCLIDLLIWLKHKNMSLLATGWFFRKIIYTHKTRAERRSEARGNFNSPLGFLVNSILKPKEGGYVPCSRASDVRDRVVCRQEAGNKAIGFNVISGSEDSGADRPRAI
jgi:hypothetical protein